MTSHPRGKINGEQTLSSQCTKGPRCLLKIARWEAHVPAPVTATPLGNSVFSCPKIIIIEKIKISFQMRVSKTTNKPRWWNKCHTEIRWLKMYIGLDSTLVQPVTQCLTETSDEKKACFVSQFQSPSQQGRHRGGTVYSSGKTCRGCSHHSRQEAESPTGTQLLMILTGPSLWPTSTNQVPPPKVSVVL